MTVTTAQPGASVRDLPLSQVTPDPNQPRKIFDPVALRELGASIKATGLLQPITVRQVGPDSYMIVAGERRYRASQLIHADTIRALVLGDEATPTIRVMQIIENDQRVDVTPLEQARSYQALMDEAQWDVEELARQIGKPSFRIEERLVLLKMLPEFQQLLSTGNLSPTEAYELARLSHRGQAALFKAISTGKCRTASDLRAVAKALRDAESQTSMLDDPEPVTEETRQHASAFERQLERIITLVNCGIKDNQVVAVHKTNPDRADHVADLLALMQKDLRRIEVALRTVVAQASLLG